MLNTFLFVYFLNKVDVQVSLSFQESQTENYLTHVVVIIIIIAEIYLTNVKSLQNHPLCFL